MHFPKMAAKIFIVSYLRPYSTYSYKIIIKIYNYEVKELIGMVYNANTFPLSMLLHIFAVKYA